MKINFQQALAFTLQFEGGWSDHPRDPGGATMKGVTLAVYRGFKGRDVSKTELRNIPDADLHAIYMQNYWHAVYADGLAPGLDACMFDFAVNSGPSRARRYNQAIPGTVTGFARIKRLCAARMGFLRGLRTFDVFGKGWTRRVVSLEAFCLKLAGARNAALVTEAHQSDADKRKATAGAAAVAPAAPATELADLSMWVQAGVVVVVMAAVGVLAFKAWQAHERAKAMREAAWGELH